MIAAVVLILALGALIVALLVQRSKRLRAEDAVRCLFATQDSEGSRLARELHDNLSQKLALPCIEIGGTRIMVTLPMNREPVRERLLRAHREAIPPTGCSDVWAQ